MRILMVCLGNICRSPLAEGILREKLKSKGVDVIIDSAGTGAYHVGKPPDNRAINTAMENGVDISQLCARQFSVKDFDAFDKIYVMDASNMERVASMARTKSDLSKVKLFLEAAGHTGDMNVPDPWYGGVEDFNSVFHLLDKASEKVAALIAEEMAAKKN